MLKLLSFPHILWLAYIYEDKKKYIDIKIIYMGFLSILFEAGISSSDIKAV